MFFFLSSVGFVVFSALHNDRDIIFPSRETSNTLRPRETPLSEEEALQAEVTQE